MGQNFQTVFSLKVLQNKELKAIIVGLDGVGKTSIMYRLRLHEKITTIPTIGFNVENIPVGNVTVTMWDIGGGQKIRALWKHYYPNTSFIIFVVDSSAPDRIHEAKE